MQNDVRQTLIFELDQSAAELIRLRNRARAAQTNREIDAVAGDLAEIGEAITFDAAMLRGRITLGETISFSQRLNAALTQLEAATGCVAVEIPQP